MSRRVPSPAERAYRRLVRRIDRAVIAHLRGRLSHDESRRRCDRTYLGDTLGRRVYDARGGAWHRGWPRR